MEASDDGIVYQDVHAHDDLALAAARCKTLAADLPGIALAESVLSLTLS
jgi:hypothetical protein